MRRLMKRASGGTKEESNEKSGNKKTKTGKLYCASKYAHKLDKRHTTFEKIASKNMAGTSLGYLGTTNWERLPKPTDLICLSGH